MLFKKYEKILYKIGNREVELVDIFTRVSFLDNISSSRAYDDYFIQEGESPEDVSSVVYGNSYYGWLILMCNNILSEDEWFSGDNQFLDMIGTKYRGESYYITNLPDLLQGDVMVKVTSTVGTMVTGIDQSKYRIISKFDKTFRSVWGYSGSGFFSPNDKIMFARKNTQNGTVESLKFKDSLSPTTDTEFATIRFIEDRKNSPIYLTNVNSVVVPPNVVYSGGTIQQEFISQNTIFTDPSDLTGNNFARTLLYGYMTNSGVVSGIGKFTYFQYERDKYNDRRKIRVLKPEYLGPTIDLIDQLVTSNEIGKKITIGF